jgi:hypothetical protein
MNFQKLLVSPLGSQRSPHQNVWFLTFNIKANRVAIVSSEITKIFNTSKYWMVIIQFLERHSFFFLISACMVCCQFYCSTFVWFSALFVFKCFICFSAFVQFGSFVQYSNYSVCFLSWSWKCIPGILIPLYTSQQAVNKHLTPDSAIFCLSIGSERPIMIMDIEGYPEPITQYELSRQQDNIILKKACGRLSSIQKRLWSRPILQWETFVKACLTLRKSQTLLDNPTGYLSMVCVLWCP